MAFVKKLRKLRTARGHGQPSDSTCPLPSTNATLFANESSKVAIQGHVHVDRQNIYITQAGATHESRSGADSSSPSERSLTGSEQLYISHLRPTPTYGREASIEERSPGTLNWLHENTAYDSWHSSETSHVLLVTGYAGCGKSVLCSFAQNSLSESASPGCVICRYYFDGTTSSQANVRAMLRSSIWQMVMARRKLAKIVKKRVMDDEQQLFTDKGDKNALWRLFQSLATHQQVRSLILIVDAIDECPDDEQDWFVRHLDEMLRLSLTPIKAFVTTRPNRPAANALEHANVARSHLELEAMSHILEQDINMFIRDKVERLVLIYRWKEDNGIALQSLVQRKAEGSFLWVSLVLSQCRHRRFLANKKDLLALVETFPVGLTHLYHSLIRAIPLDERSLAGKTICLIESSRRHLTVYELNAVLAIDPSHRFVADFDADQLFENVHDVESLLNGLVKTPNNRVALVHYTLKEYLAKHQHYQDDADIHSFGETPTSSRRIVAENCMRYLLLEDFEHDLFSDFMSSTSTSPLNSSDSCSTDSGDSTSDSRNSLQMLFKEPAETTREVAMAIAARYRFFDYAARFWTFHFAEVQHDLHSELENLALALYEADRRRNWFKYVSSLAEDREYDEYPSEPDALTLACFYGHTAMLRIVLAGHSEASSPALYWAAANGHASCVSTLLSARPAQHGWLSYKGRSPLAVAVARGHKACVENILSSDTFGINDLDLDGRTPLSVAAGGAYLDIVRAILSYKSADVNFPDHSGATPIFWAVRVNSKEVVEHLLADSRTRFDHMDCGQRSALSWACEYGFMDIVELLARRGRHQLDQADIRGRTPLMYAAKFGHGKLVRYLVRSGVDPSRQDDGGRNAMSLAAESPNVDILEYLLRKDPLGLDVKDVDGWTAFAWTFGPPEQYQNAVILLSHAPPACRDDGLMMFVLALRWGAFAIAKELISRQAFFVNETSSEGRTAISFAAESGHEGLVRQLLTTAGIEKDMADCHGRTPYSFAAKRHHDKICRLLRHGL